MKKKIAVILCLVLGFTAAACGLSDAATEKEATETADSAGTSQEDSSTEKMTVNVGISMGVTGSLAASTEQFTVGIQAALQQLEEDGGLENYNIELHIEDDQSDIVQTVTNANKLIYDTGVNVIMGPTSATYALSIADIAEEEKIPMMPGSWTPSLTHSGYEYIVRVCPNDMTSSDTVMSYLVEELGYSNIALLYLNSEQGSTGLDYGNASLEEYGMEYSIAEAWNSGDTDMSGQILKIAETNPEAVVVWGGTASEMAIALEQLNQYMDESVTICASTMAGQPSVAELLDPSCLTGVVYSIWSRQTSARVGMMR